jgi:hypothetical protein
MECPHTPAQEAQMKDEDAQLPEPRTEFDQEKIKPGTQKTQPSTLLEWHKARFDERRQTQNRPSESLEAECERLTPAICAALQHLESGGHFRSSRVHPLTIRRATRFALIALLTRFRGCLRGAAKRVAFNRHKWEALSKIRNATHLTESKRVPGPGRFTSFAV